MIIRKLSILSLLFFVHACSTQITTGTLKDFDTGLTTSYSELEPKEIFLVMNNEVVHNNKVPLGESFIIVNNGITGVASQTGEVKIGCALKIKDMNGIEHMHEDDLFAGHDVFTDTEAATLKCTVNTGAPMKAEQDYCVHVLFWDKNRKGTIENKITIRTIAEL